MKFLGLTKRCSEPCPAPVRSIRVVISSSLRPCALSGAVAVDIFFPVKTPFGLPVHVAPLPAGSILVFR
jgi:hypothetical protein